MARPAQKYEYLKHYVHNVSGHAHLIWTLKTVRLELKSTFDEI